MQLDLTDASPSESMLDGRRVGATLKAGAAQPVLVLLDERPLSRAAYELLLHPWAREEKLHLVAGSHPLTQGHEDWSSAAIVILCTGGARGAQLEERVAAVCRDADGAPVVVLSESDAPTEVVIAFRSGARGYMTGQTEPGILFGALRCIRNGGMYFPPSAILERTVTAPRRSTLDAGGLPLEANGPSGDLRLTPRQHSVLRLQRQGHSNKRIGRELDMCESTVKVHVRQILRRLGVANRTEAAVRAGLLQPANDGMDAALDPSVSGR